MRNFFLPEPPLELALGAAAVRATAQKVVAAARATTKAKQKAAAATTAKPIVTTAVPTTILTGAGAGAATGCKNVISTFYLFPAVTT